MSHRVQDVPRWAHEPPQDRTIACATRPPASRLNEIPKHTSSNTKICPLRPPQDRSQRVQDVPKWAHEPPQDRTSAWIIRPPVCWLNVIQNTPQVTQKICPLRLPKATPRESKMSRDGPTTLPNTTQVPVLLDLPYVG